MALGAAGVTVFFVLSGFLITGLLIEERATIGAVHLRGFYSLRVRRLAPAFLALVITVVVLSPLLGTWWFEWRDLPPVLLYFGNWVEAANAGPGVALGALSITWSLAIEEQFYILWPIVVLALGQPHLGHKGHFCMAMDKGRSGGIERLDESLQGNASPPNHQRGAGWFVTVHRWGHHWLSLAAAGSDAK